MQHTLETYSKAELHEALRRRLGEGAAEPNAYLVVVRASHDPEVLVFPWKAAFRPVLGQWAQTAPLLEALHSVRSPVADVDVLPVLASVGWTQWWQHSSVHTSEQPAQDEVQQALSELDAAINRLHAEHAQLSDGVRQFEATMLRHEAAAETLLDVLDLQFKGGTHERERHDH